MLVKKILLTASTCGLLLSAAASHAYDCTSLPNFTAGNVSTGAKVKNNNTAFECKVGGWCSLGGPYEPGVGWAQEHAWTNLGACSTTQSSVGQSSVSSAVSSVVSSKSSSSIASSKPSSSSSSIANCGSPWVPTATYVKDNIVIYNGQIWRAKWWTQNETPSTGGSGVWELIGSCGSSSSSSKSSIPSSSSSSVRSSSSSSIPNGATWSDEFDSINSNVWTFETGGGGWGNNERQYYTGGQNASIQYDNAAGSNVLVIEARRDNPANYSCWYGRCEYTSTRMITNGKKTFTYGRIEARMKLPQTQGIWPAFWLLGSDINSVGWPACGEIDIMEHVGYEPNITHGALHGPGYSGNTPFAGTNYFGESVANGYHVYAVEWNSNGITYLVDGTKFYSLTKAQVQTYGNWVFDHPMFILLNVAVGGNWPGSPVGNSVFPQRMYVDYVR
ncbi:MAG: glycosyl hydrolase family protein, partial [Moraxellaceae bacterium]